MMSGLKILEHVKHVKWRGPKQGTIYFQNFAEQKISALKKLVRKKQNVIAYFNVKNCYTV